MSEGQINSRKICILGFVPIFILLLLISACAPPPQDQGETPTKEPPQATEKQPSESPLPAAPPDTKTPPPSPTATPVPTATSTPTPYVIISSDTNCRIGPGSFYDWLYTYLAGDQALVLGKSPDEAFWYTSDQSGIVQDCWLWGKYATPVGDTSLVPIFTPPPTPTPRPDFAVSFVDYDGAAADIWLWFKINNTGSAKWESILVYTKNIDTGDIAVNISNTFKDGIWTGSDITHVPVGGSGFISSGQLFKPFGYTIDVYVIACAKDDLGELCQTRYLSIDFTTP